ncbi:hypothetical protein [Erwinia piriflorinigrans]|uniref:hypothetical protein n=1 Tax=Erwinia piriflorinigrans TaxID=665097 RepID=UPI000907E76B|nr:hypothetical protein [Erwinia piriflorinigrans]
MNQTASTHQQAGVAIDVVPIFSLDSEVLSRYDGQNTKLINKRICLGRRLCGGLNPSVRVGQLVKLSLKRQCVSSASYALRASLGTRFTRTQVTPRSSALNAVVEDAQMCQMVIPTPQSSQPAFSVKSK